MMGKISVVVLELLLRDEAWPIKLGAFCLTLQSPQTWFITHFTSKKLKLVLDPQ